MKFFLTDFSAPIRARFFKFCMHLERVEVYCVKENHGAEVNFPFFFSFFFPFSIFYFNVMHMEICVKVFQELRHLGY